MPTLVYKYGLRPPTMNADLVRAQMRAGHDYRNRLIEIERQRRAAIRPLLGTPELEAAVQKTQLEVEEADREIRRLRSATRSRSETKEQRERLSLAKVARAAAKAALSEERKRLNTDPAIQAAKDRINEENGAAKRAARNAPETPYWGTYLLSEDAMQKAVADTPLFSGMEPNDPRFRRWAGEGAVGVQLQGGLPVSGVFGADTQLQIVAAKPPPPRKDGKPVKVGTKDFRVLRVRVGSEGRMPIWAEFPMLMHRPLPHDAIIKTVVVKLHKQARFERWLVYFTVSAEAEEPTCGTGAVAIDVGWRSMGDGSLRVATWMGEDGRRGELRLSADNIKRLRKPEDLRRIRDLQFDGAKAALANAVAKMAKIPDWLTEALTTLHAWKSQARLARVCQQWAENRFEGDEEIFFSLADPTNRDEKGHRADWLGKDRHLWEYEAGAQRRALANRKQGYRVWAKELSLRYRTIVWEDFDLRRIAERPDKVENETARSNRQVVATSELRLSADHAFARAGGRSEKVDAIESTRECAGCHHVDVFDAAADIQHRCSACGVLWDQDENAAENILHRFLERERASAASPPVGAREAGLPSDVHAMVESRWVKARRKRAERDARLGAARKPPSNQAE